MARSLSRSAFSLSAYSVERPALAFAQTPAAPADPSQPQQPGQPQGQQPRSPHRPRRPIPRDSATAVPDPAPGRIPPIRPRRRPVRRLPPWTPPVPPPPSQTNVPSPSRRTRGSGTPGAAEPWSAGPRGSGSLCAHADHGSGRDRWSSIRRLGRRSSIRTTSSRRRAGASTTFARSSAQASSCLLNGARTFGTLSTTVDLVHDTASGTGDESQGLPESELRAPLRPDAASGADPDGHVRAERLPDHRSSSVCGGAEQTFNTNTAGLSVDWLLDQVGHCRRTTGTCSFQERTAGAGRPPTTGSGSDDSLTHVWAERGTRIAIDYLVGSDTSFPRPMRAGTRLAGAVAGAGLRGRLDEPHRLCPVARQFGLYTTAGISTSYSIPDRGQHQDLEWLPLRRLWIADGALGVRLVGYSLLNSDVEDNEGTVTANLRASYRFAGRAMVSVGIFRDFRQTAQTGQDFGTVSTPPTSEASCTSSPRSSTHGLSAVQRKTSPTGTGNSTAAAAQTRSL